MPARRPVRSILNPIIWRMSCSSQSLTAGQFIGPLGEPRPLESADRVTRLRCACTSRTLRPWLVLGYFDVLFETEDFFHDTAEIREYEIMMNLPHPRRFEEQRGAAGGSGRFGILPLIADDKGVVQVQVPLESRLDEQSRPRLAAGTMIVLVVRAHHDVVQRKGPAQDVMHAVQFATGLIASGEFGLIVGGNQDKAGRFQLAERRPGVLDDLKFL